MEYLLTGIKMFLLFLTCVYTGGILIQVKYGATIKIIDRIMASGCLALFVLSMGWLD